MTDSRQGASSILLLEWWKPIPGWEGIYEISNMGRIWGVERVKRNGRRIRGRVCKSSTPENGYPVIVLRCGDKIENAILHCLVAKTFLGPRPEKYEVNHKDRNRGNPSVSNLEYGTSSYNKKYSNISVGEQNVNAKLSERDVLAIRRMKGKRPQCVIADEYNVSRSLICMVMSGKVWAHLSED